MAHSDRYLLFIEYFNTGKFMSAQTTLDEDWIEENSERKNFLGGLIQVSVALYHLTNGNPQGAPKIWLKARAMLEPYGKTMEGIDLVQLFKDMDELFATSNEQMTDLDHMKRVPKISFQG